MDQLFKLYSYLRQDRLQQLYFLLKRLFDTQPFLANFQTPLFPGHKNSKDLFNLLKKRLFDASRYLAVFSRFWPFFRQPYSQEMRIQRIRSTFSRNGFSMRLDAPPPPQLRQGWSSRATCAAAFHIVRRLASTLCFSPRKRILVSVVTPKKANLLQFKL